MTTFLNSLQFSNPSIFTVAGISAIVFYFTIYSFLGWMLENTYNLVTRGRFLKPNFLTGPFKPMYGFTPVLLIYLIGEQAHWVSVLLLCFFIPSTVEYVTGALLQKFFRKQWWDYSNHRLQLHGHVCLYFSVCWVVLSVVGLKWLHPEITTLFSAVEPYWTAIFPAVIIYFLIDLYFAIRIHSMPRLYLVKSTNTLRK